MIGKLLETIKIPSDLRRLNVEQLTQLAEEIRHLIKTSVSINGGHLASNLGVVELTIALHYVFDFASDRLLWDVGHQCYVHKVLTGRAPRFTGLRQVDGLSGFPDPRESVYDPFFVGHAGTAVTSAVGLALAAQLKQTPEKIVAVVGDASIVNGPSFEGLNNTSLVHRQLLIILNDNSMAIDKTQGAFARYLTRLTISRPYEDLHRRTKLLVQRLPYIGQALEETIGRIKGGIKTTLQGPQIFEQLGIPYYGPIDGHDISALIKFLTAFKKVDHPVILHLQTQKGRGFAPARRDPCAFHSTRPFSVDGDSASFTDTTGRSFTAAFTSALKELMSADERIIALTAAMTSGTGLTKIRDIFPQRVIDVGIAESAAVDIAAGLAKKGFIPIVALYSTFLQRAFDQVFQEVSLQKLPVIFCIDRAGPVGGDGPTHHGFCDIAFLRCLPHMVLISPMDEAEMKEALSFAVRSRLPCALRYPRDRVPPRHALPVEYQCEPFKLGRAAWVLHGDDAVILAYGALAHEALLAAEILSAEGIQVAVVSARFAKPLDEPLIRQLLAEDKTMPIITLEDHVLAGGFGSAVLELAQQLQLDTRRITSLALPDRYLDQNIRAGQLAEAGIDHQSLVKKIRQLLHRAPLTSEIEPSVAKTVQKL